MCTSKHVREYYSIYAIYLCNIYANIYANSIYANIYANIYTMKSMQDNDILKNMCTFHELNV